MAKIDSTPNGIRKKVSIDGPTTSTHNKLNYGITVTEFGDNDSLGTSKASIMKHEIQSSHLDPPDLVSEETSRCDACPYCDDVCSDPQCRTCSDFELVRRPQSDKERASLPATFRFFGTTAHADTSHSENYYTPCQVRRHNTLRSAWLVCGDAIYDATEYIQNHPGGERSILRKSGGISDCTEDMAFHSKKAVQVWKKNQLGRLRACPGKCAVGPECIDFKGEQCVIS